jgi:three-Cys-motif partner protein
LQAWFPILSQEKARFGGRSREILFIDGFAGPGEYEGGELGSPVLALLAALEHRQEFPIPVRFLFIEQHPERYHHLERVLARYHDQVERSKNVRLAQPDQGECDTVLTEILERHETAGTHFGPALAFLDQFGYAAVSMALVRRILAFPQCEVFLYLDYKDMNRFITDPSKASGFTRTYGGEEWQGAIDLPESERRIFLLEKYKESLRHRGNAKYVCAFSMFDSRNQPLYWLVFCTNHLRGLEEMKKAMWSVDDTGEFRFSDNDNPDQLRLLRDEFDQGWLADHLSLHLAGKTLTVGEIKKYVFCDTPCYLFKEALKLLEVSEPARIKVVKAREKRRRGSYPDDDMEIQFLRRGLL